MTSPDPRVLALLSDETFVTGLAESAERDAILAALADELRASRSAVAVLDDALKAATAPAKKAIAAAKAASDTPERRAHEALIDGVRAVWRRCLEAAFAARARCLEAAAEAAARGDYAEHGRLMSAVPKDPTAEGVVVTHQVVFDVVDAAAVPAAFCSPDPKKISEAMSTDATLEVPGVVCRLESRATFRGDR